MNSNPISRTHIPELDGVRGLAALMVVVWHFVGVGLFASPDAVPHLIGQIMMFGRSGVDLFFVLSGFLITGILLDNGGRPAALISFYTRRFFRIWPAYLLLIAMVVAVAKLIPAATRAADGGRMFNDQIPIWSYLLFAQTLFMSAKEVWGSGALSVSWSVAIEEHFYLFFPFVLLLTPRRWLLLVVAAIGIASAASRAGLALARPELYYTPYVLTPFRLDGLCAGAILAILIRNQSGQALLRPYALRPAAAIVGTLTITAVIWSYGTAQLFVHQFVWGHALLSVFYAVMIALVISEREQWKGLTHPALRHFGDLSYVLYLFHPLALGVVFLFATGTAERLQSWSDVPLLALAAAISYAGCLFIHQMFEQPFRQFGRHLTWKPWKQHL